jgi:hypothetical protein
MARPRQSPGQANPPPAGLRVLGSLDAPVDPDSFLEKRSYRRRRMTDALRLLPILGLWLFMVPLLWPGAAARLTGMGVSMSSALIYIFAVWTGLIVLCAALSPPGGQGGEPGRGPGETGPGETGPDTASTTGPTGG